MQDFNAEHRALILKHARLHVRSQAEKIAPEDVAREVEIMLAQLGAKTGLDPSTIEAPDAYLRSIVKHAAGRAKRRKTLISQVAAGDDLHAVSDDLAALDADLPPLPSSPTPEQAESHAALEALKSQLPPTDALVAALVFEDEMPTVDAARTIAELPDEIDLARDRIIRLAESLGVSDAPKTLPVVARKAAGAPVKTPHVEEPLLALIRNGDLGDDIQAEIGHVARCADCRALLTDGIVERRSVVIVAIEAPRTSHHDLQKVAEQAQARLVGRGSGRWTAVVSAENATSFKETLERPEVSGVSRIAAGTPIDVPVEETPIPLRTSRARLDSVPPVPGANVGIDAAEAAAWAQVGRAPKKKTPGPHPVWTAIAVMAVVGATVIAYILATRMP